MTQSATPATQKNAPVTLWGIMMSLTGKLIGVLVVSIIFSIIVEWVMMVFIRETSAEPRYFEAKSMFEYEVQFIEHFLMSASNTAMSIPIVNIAQSWMGSCIEYLFIDSGLLHFFSTLDQQKEGEWKITRYFKNLMHVYSEFLVAAIYVLMMFVVRLTILILSLPIFVIFGVVGLVDGLMQRDLRRWRAGNESSYVYHMAKRFSFPIITTGMIIYLSSPFSINPNYIIVPTAVAFGGIVMLMSSKFKKYL